MTVIYLRAGLYAEGPSDYRFLCPLLDRLIAELAASLFPASHEVGETLGIDTRVQGSRADRIAAAVAENIDACTVFVVHADGGGDPAGARQSAVDPGLARARDQVRLGFGAAACIPVRELEAWMLADSEPFRAILGRGVTPSLPEDPERDLDPKATLRRILGRMRGEPTRIYALFGELVRLDALRALPAFRDFEKDLTAALRSVDPLDHQDR
jgi:hypothetical protein